MPCVEEAIQCVPPLKNVGSGFNRRLIRETWKKLMDDGLSYGHQLLLCLAYTLRAQGMECAYPSACRTRTVLQQVVPTLRKQRGRPIVTIASSPMAFLSRIQQVCSPSVHRLQEASVSRRVLRCVCPKQKNLDFRLDVLGFFYHMYCSTLCFGDSIGPRLQASLFQHNCRYLVIIYTN